MRHDNDKIEALLRHRVSWLSDSGPEDDIAISSRIRLARNLAGVNFPGNCEPGQLGGVRDAVAAAAEKTGFLRSSLEFDIGALDELDRQLLLERRLISREMARRPEGAGLVVCGDETLGVMINEEDHIRMQCMCPGFQLEEVWERISAIDDAMAGSLPYVFDGELGFLTSCPTNVGTGMRASVMLHLPGLVLEEQINAVTQGVGKLGLAVRGIFGEGSENLGNLFQISNQSTLGESEERIVERLGIVIGQIIAHEKAARQRLVEQRQNFLLDHVGRAYGILRHAYIVSSQETLDSLSALRVGVDLGMFNSIDIHTVNELFVIIQPAHLQKSARKSIDSKERDILRATLIRERLKDAKENGRANQDA